MDDWRREIIELIYGTPELELMLKMVFEQIEKNIGIDTGVFLPFPKEPAAFDFSGHIPFRVEGYPDKDPKKGTSRADVSSAERFISHQLYLQP